MGKKCLILYASHTGNTEKVALRFKKVFEKYGWECDSFRLNRKTDLDHLPFNFNNYDFACIGSGIELHEPYSEIVAAMRIPRYGFDPKNPPKVNPDAEGLAVAGKPPMQHKRIILGPDSKKAIVFVTYAGYDLGPEEAEPALALLALEVAHLEFRCIGKFCCPGKFVNEPTPETFWGDIRDRPNERDLLKAEIFMEEILESIRDTC